MTAYPVRFLQNNMAAADGSTVTGSSFYLGFPVSNSVTEQRHARWIPAGSFRVVSTNKKIYISDGSNKTITLTEAIYATGTALATHIQTQLNASSSSWTCTYSLTTFKFTIGRASGTATIRLTQTTDAAWSMLGYLGAADTATSTGLAADAVRNHTSERWQVDLGVAKNVTAFAVIGQADTDFTIADSATCVLKHNSIDDYDTATAITLTPEATGIFEFLDETKRYWWFDFIDLDNPAGPTSFELKIYLGDYIAPITRNMNLGFNRSLIDPSIVQESDSGVQYARRRSKYWFLSSNVIEWLADSERTELERCITEMGQTTPFFVSIDPGAEISASVGELTKYVTFSGPPSVTQLRHKYYSINLQMREVVG